jgi:predicted ATPase
VAACLADGLGAQVAQFLFERHPDRFAMVLEVMQRRVPGVVALAGNGTIRLYR